MGRGANRSVRAGPVVAIVALLGLGATSRAAPEPPPAPPAIATEWVWLLERAPAHVELVARRVSEKYAGALGLPPGVALDADALAATSGTALLRVPTDPGRTLPDSDCLAEARREFRALLERRDLAARESARSWQEAVGRGDAAAVAALYVAASDLRTAVAAGAGRGERMRSLAAQGLLALIVNEVSEALSGVTKAVLDLVPERAADAVRSVWSWKGARDAAAGKLKQRIKKALETGLAASAPEDLEDVAAHLDDLADSLALLHAFWRPQRSDVPSMSATPAAGERDPLVDPLWYDLEGPIAKEHGYKLAFSLAYADDDVLAAYVDTLTWHPSDRMQVGLARDSLRAFRGVEALQVTDRWTDGLGKTYERSHTSGPPGDGDGDFPALRGRFEERRRAVEQEAVRGADVVAAVLEQAGRADATDVARLRALGLWALVKRDARTLAAHGAAEHATERWLLEKLADKLADALANLGPVRALGPAGKRWVTTMLKKAGKRAAGWVIDERPETAFEELDADVLAMVRLVAPGPAGKPVLPGRDLDVARLLDPARTPLPVACGAGPARPPVVDDAGAGLYEVEVVVTDPQRSPSEVYRGVEQLVVEDGSTLAAAVERRRKDALAEWGSHVQVEVRRTGK